LYTETINNSRIVFLAYSKKNVLGIDLKLPCDIMNLQLITIIN